MLERVRAAAGQFEVERERAAAEEIADRAQFLDQRVVTVVDADRGDGDAGRRDEVEALEEEVGAGEGQPGFAQAADDQARIVAQPAQVDPAAEFEQQQSEAEQHQRPQVAGQRHRRPGQHPRPEENAGGDVAGQAGQRAQALTEFGEPDRRDEQEGDAGVAVEFGGQVGQKVHGGTATNGLSGFEQCYNAQAVVDAESMLVMVPHVTDAANDKEQVAPMVEKLQALPEGLNQPDTALIDSGYFSEKNVATCVAAKITPLIAVGREGHHPDWRERFTEPGPLAADATPVETMKHTLKTKAGRALYALRKQTVEPVFGIIKSVMGFRQFLMRGLENVRIEWTLVCLAWNLKRMAVLRLQ